MTRKKSQNSLRLWEIWANLLLPKALKSCPKSNKLPDLVTLLPTYFVPFDLQQLSLLSYRLDLKAIVINIFEMICISLSRFEYFYVFSSSLFYKLGISASLKECDLMAKLFWSKKMGQPWSLFHLFSSFQTHITIFTTNRYLKNVHRV